MSIDPGTRLIPVIIMMENMNTMITMIIVIIREIKFENWIKLTRTILIIHSKSPSQFILGRSSCRQVRRHHKLLFIIRILIKMIIIIIFPKKLSTLSSPGLVGLRPAGPRWILEMILTGKLLTLPVCSSERTWSSIHRGLRLFKKKNWTVSLILHAVQHVYS